MEGEIRKTGIDIIGDAPWGTHFCQFYETKEDLIDVLVPYFKAGLENNEFCIWVTSEPLDEEAAKKAMREVVPDFDRYLKRGQIEIVPHSEWYLKDCAFNLQRVLNAWIDKLNQALAKGYDGLRVTGNTGWLEKRDWRSLADYEKEVNDVIGKYRMIAICSYSLDKCGASEVIDVVRDHQFALIKRRGAWELIESSELKRSREVLRKSEEKYRSVVESIQDGLTIIEHGKVTYVNDRACEIFGYPKAELVELTGFDVAAPEEKERLKRTTEESRRTGTSPKELEFWIIRKDGTRRYIHNSYSIIRKGDELIRIVVTTDITERKRFEEGLSALNIYSRKLNMAESMEEIHELTLDAAERTLGFEYVDILIIEGKMLCLMTYRGQSKISSLKLPLDEDKGITVRAARTGKPVLVPDISKEKAYVEGGVDIRSELAVPIKIGNRVLGVLNVESKRLNAFDEKDQKLLEILASHAATAISNLEHAKNLETYAREIRESQQKFERLFMGNPEAAVYLGPDFHILDANPRFEELFGYSLDEIKGKHINDVLVPEDKMEEGKMLDKKAEEGYVHYDTLRKRKDGSLVPVSISAAPLIVEGKNIGVVGLYKDITERERTEEALRRSEEQARLLLEFQNKVIDTAVVWIDLLDTEGNVTLWNRAAELISGYSREEVIGHKKAWEWLYPDPKYRAEIFADFKEIIEIGERVDIDKTTIKCKDGTLKTISWYSSAILDEKGKPVGFISVGIDTTEIIKAQEKVRESEERFRALSEKYELLLKTASEGIAAVDPDENLTFVNRAFADMLGYKESELVGMNMRELVSAEAFEKMRKGTKRRKRGESDRYEVAMYRKDGEPRTLLLSAAPLWNADETYAGTLGVLTDITERKTMEEKLRESEERFRNLYESIRDPVGVFVGREGRLIDYNKAFKRLSGYTNEELKDKTFLDFVHPDDQAMVLEKYRTKYPEEELPLVYEIRVLNKKGEIIPLEISVSTYNVKGKVIGIEVIHRDITERKRAEEELIRLSSAVKMSTDSIVISDLDGKIIDVNEATLKMYGTDDKRDLIGKNSFDLIAPEDQEKALAGTKETLEKGSVKGREYNIITKDGGRILVEMSAAIMKDRDGKPIGFVGISRDITERKKMEEKLRQYSEHLEELVQKRTKELLESEKRYSVLVEEASDGVAIVQDGKIVFINKRTSDISGYLRDELIGLSLEKLVDERYRQLVKERYMRRLRGETLPATYEVEFAAKTGECVPVEVSATLMNYQGRPADLVIIRDIRERKRMEEERLKLEKLATIGEIATMVGHDLRNPLQSIENATYYLNNELLFLSPSIPNQKKVMEMLKVLTDSVNYADNIIRDLQDFAATKTPTLKKTNINNIVAETLSQIQIPKNVKLTTELGHFPEIKVDQDMIIRVFINLAINGIQAMENGGTLTVSTKKTQSFVEIGFKDTGAGISKENMEKLFNPFFTTKAKGIGMGLPICKKFVESHGGIIQVESEEGKGSTFTVKLPIKQNNGGENP